jgi:hypothetical protein
MQHAAPSSYKLPVPGLVPGTHAFLLSDQCRPKTWMAGTTPYSHSDGRR